jgi:hypothetical protein
VAQVIDLPDELAATAGPACIIWNVNERAAFVVKLDRQTIDGFRGALPIGLHAECGFYPDSAVIRLELSFHDRPSSPYVFDVFLNVMQPMHLSLLRPLQDQETIEIHFLGVDNRHALTKSISYPARNRHELSALVDQAIEHNCRLLRLDFAAAKAALLRDRPL